MPSLLKQLILKPYLAMVDLGRAMLHPVDTVRKLYLRRKGHRLVSYTTPDGTFDYDRYRTAQEEANIRKLHMVAAKQELISFLSGYLTDDLGLKVTFGICHGTRRGMEQKWFNQYMGTTNVIGTEISKTAVEFENTIQWDFHDLKDEWIGAADFIYSNSWDHSYDPQKCISNWLRCLKDDGVCILEHTSYHTPEHTDGTDLFGADLESLTRLIDEWGQGAFRVRTVLKNPHHPSIRHIVIKPVR